MTIQLEMPHLTALGLHARLDGGNYFIYHHDDDDDDDEDVDADNSGRSGRDSLFSLPWLGSCSLAVFRLGGL